jgi:hypothetical protein
LNNGKINRCSNKIKPLFAQTPLVPALDNAD